MNNVRIVCQDCYNIYKIAVSLGWLGICTSVVVLNWSIGNTKPHPKKKNVQIHQVNEASILRVKYPATVHPV